MQQAREAVLIIRTFCKRKEHRKLEQVFGEFCKQHLQLKKESG